VPFVAIVLDQIALRIVLWSDDRLGWTFYAIGVHGMELGLPASFARRGHSRAGRSKSDASRGRLETTLR
jgi:hypothetical protein